jgi:coniferyl-aldehyde dehydrogenase
MHDKNTKTGRRAVSEQLEKILTRQRTAFLAQGAPSLAQRRATLKRLRALVLARRSDIEDAVSADFGHRARHETAAMEILTVLKGIDYLHRNLRRFMRPEKRHVEIVFRSGKARIEYQPLGVVGIVAPWNYPFSLAMMPLATALAAGNRAMIKPSEFTPKTSELLQDMLVEIHAEDEVAVVLGDGALGAAFCALPFDHLMFTGSPQVGRAVMKAASTNLVPVTLELGGKSPAIVASGHAHARTASSIAYGKLSNAGQTCVAPDYVLVHEKDLDAFVASFDAAVAALYPQGPASMDYTSILNDRHFGRLRGLLDDASAKGARVIEAGVRPKEATNRAHTLAPTLVLDVTDEMAVMREEIFGPVLPVRTYRDIAEAIAYVNANPRPLALYYFGEEGSECREVLSRTTSGNVGVNNTLLHVAQDDLPFGGVGNSGIGAYHGIEGFRAMSHAKGIFIQGRWNAANMLRAPFGRIADLTLSLLIR